ncbi:magnesium chelatase subunit H [Thalassobaculum sp. OXR-137]|uniref:magnesium chelatase subunit H n=1 Tax=Thalassobaculum sp. OXR-137 TaxID=3100173 RepID=UPI002AC9DB37|nr:magnesium chelatase subunit H [Thalassobaculum sp. OXR-137]WPZ36827.1 magnesium chelatase subunit H [Thalassobaculum sp. OXR-137]
MRKPITRDRATPPVRVVVVTMDSHLANVVLRAGSELRREIPGLRIDYHAASDWSDNPGALERCKADIAQGDIVIVTMLFIEEHIRPVLEDLRARRDHCDALVCCLSEGAVVRLTKLGGFKMDGSQKGPLSLLKKLRGSKNGKSSSGAGQMAMLRRLPRILRFIPGTAQDMRAYFLSLQFWLAGSDVNVANMIRLLIDRYADGERRVLRGSLTVGDPVEYPDVGLYHPRLEPRITDRLDRLPRRKGAKGRVGVLILRSYALAGDTGHYDAMLQTLEARGLEVVPAFASGLDCRPAVQAFFMKDGKATVDAVLSLTSFSLVGGPAYNDAAAAEDMLAQLDVPYLIAQAVEFQTLEQWRADARGLLPVESTIMVAIPELDGAIAPTVFGGRTGEATRCADCDPSFCANRDGARAMCPDMERVNALAARVEKLVALRHTPVEDRKVAVVLFNFPPNSGATGTAAYLSVFESLFRVLKGMAAAGYRVDVPADVDDLRGRILAGNAARFGADANVLTRITADDHVRSERHLTEIEAVWGRAPGRHQSDGRSIFVLGAEFGNVIVGIQPAFGYEGDPMRMLFEKGLAPTHAFSAFYRWLREDFAADAVLHFGTHGALEFMPGKQTGVSGACWPERLIGSLPNIYLYAANNPSEGTIAKRRAGATLVSYLTPPVTNAGLYKGLIDLKEALTTWRQLAPDAETERARLAPVIQAQAAAFDMTDAEPAWPASDADAHARRLTDQVAELEQTLIPHGLHVVGQPTGSAERFDLLMAVSEARTGTAPAADAIRALVAGAPPRSAAGPSASADLVAELTLLADMDAKLQKCVEIDALLHALDGRYIRPVAGGDLLRTPAILPTGRNIHGFDPYRLPSAFAVADGAAQADRLIERHRADGNGLPETVAIVLWGTDNLKSAGGPIGQALALMGTTPRFDSYGRLCGAELIPLEVLGRPRIDVMMTLSGIFRDLLPLQTKLLAEAAYIAAAAEDEPEEMNFVRKHALAYQAAQGCDFETASLRVFSNADGAYGSNVNLMVDNGAWQDGDELAETYTNRKCYAYGRSGRQQRQHDLLQRVLGDVQLAYQNLESVELGVTTVDHYFDTLGGIGRAVRRARGAEVPVYIGDQTRGAGLVRSLGEQVALESRTRVLNPKWYEGMLEHGYEGVRNIEAQVTNTMGWSATTGQVAPWVYEQITETFVLDPAMRERLAALNPKASARVANRLLEAHERHYWSPDPETLSALREAGDELEDRLEGITTGTAAA